MNATSQKSPSPHRLLYKVCYTNRLLLVLHGRTQLSRQNGYNLVQVADYTKIGYLEDGSEFVLVNGNDIIALFHTGQVLDGT